MSLTEITVTRPQRWDVPFGDAMRDADVDELLKIEPFASMDAERFPAAIPLRGILKNDTRVSSYQDGDIVVREGGLWQQCVFDFERHRERSPRRFGPRGPRPTVAGKTKSVAPCETPNRARKEASMERDACWNAS